MQRKREWRFTKRIIAFFLTAIMVWQNTMPRMSFGNESNATSVYFLSEDEISVAVRKALKKGKTVQKESFQIEGNCAYEYEELLGVYDDSELYKIELPSKLENAEGSLKKIRISSYVKLSNDNKSRIVFLVKGGSKKNCNVSFNILGNVFSIYVPGVDVDDVNVATNSDIENELASSSNIVVATGSDVTNANTFSIVQESGDKANDNMGISILDSAAIDGKSVVAFSIPADDFIKYIDAEEYSYETDSAVISAFAPQGAFNEHVTLEAREFSEDEEETMNEILHASGKLFAGKKSFDIHFLSENGVEVEPNCAVKVSIKIKQGNFPENADPDSFKIFHMTEEEAANAATKVSSASRKIDDANSIDLDIGYSNSISDNNSLDIPITELAADTEENNNEFETNFVTDSFSYFVLNYNGFNQVFTYLYDGNGNLLPGDELAGYVGANNKFNPLDFCANWKGGWGSSESQNKWISVKTLTSLLASKTAGYTYVDAFTDSEMTNAFNWIYFSLSSGYRGTWWVSTSKDKPTSSPSSGDGTSRRIAADSDGVMKLYIKFNNDVVSSELKDEVEENGYFLAEAPTNISEYATVNYKWYRSDDGITYEEVTRKKAVNKTYNVEVDETGSKLYPSRDIATGETVRRWYKAEIYVDEKLYKEYAPRQVQDYTCIMNGSFESPDVTLMGGTASYDFPVGTEELYWNTSATDKQIEVIHTGDKANQNYGCMYAADGDQWVELNAEAPGALFQHVLVQPGTTLYWQFSHRARSSSESMYLVIAPRKAVSSASTTTELTTLAEKILSNTDGYTEAEGYQALSVTDGNTAWVTYEGTYEVPDSTWLLSFFFISNTGVTTGNFIDNVSFSTTVPGPLEGCANITAQESVSGLLSDDIAKLSMHVWLEDSDGNVATDKNGTKAEKTVTFSETTDEKGVYTKKVAFPNMPDDKEYTIKKVLFFDGSEVVPDAYERVEENYVVIRNNVREDKGVGSVARFMAYDEAKDKIKVEFTDNFEMNLVPVTVRKKLVGNAVDTDKEFTFTISGTLKNGATITSEIANDERIFTLRGGEEKVINIPFGSTVTISENDYSCDKYVTYYEMVPGETMKGREATLPEVTLDKEVVFTNKRVEYAVTMKKVDENGNRLGNAELSLYDGENLSDDTRIGNTITDGVIDWTVNLCFGDYTLSEISAPAGYKIADAIHFTVNDDGTVESNVDGVISTTDNVHYVVTMTDVPLIGSVILENSINEKYNPFGTPSFIYEITKKEGTYKKVVILTMDSLKKNEAFDLPTGDYIVKQISVSRYVPETESMDFTVTDGETVKLSFKNTIMQYEKFSHVTKVVNCINKSS